MKNKIYPFLLGLSCIVIVALVSFKNGEKVSEKEHITVIAEGYGILTKSNYKIFVSTKDKYESINPEENKDRLNYTFLIKKIKEYEKAGWVIKNNNMTYVSTGHPVIYYTLERDKQ